MPTRVRLADGRVVTVQTDDPEEAAAAAHRFQQANPIAQSGEPQLNERQRQDVSSRAFRRQVTRGIMPGIGAIAQPFANMLGDPDRRANVGESFQGFLRDVQSIPSLDLPRLARETGASVQQGVRDLPQTAGNVLTHLPEVARAITYGPFEDEELAQQRLDMARALGDQGGVREQAAEANRQTASAGLNVAAPLALGSAPSVLRAGATAAALDAPFALSRNSDQPLQERLPDALTEIGGSGAAGGGLQALINGGSALSRALPSRGREMVARMDRAGASVDARGNPVTPRGVTPSLATANRGVGVSGPTTNMIGDNVIAGPMVRRRSRRSLTEIRDAAHDIGSAYGRAQSRDAAGLRVQHGLERFAGDTGAPAPAGVSPQRLSTRDMGFRTKSRLVFDEALRPVASNPARLTETRRVLAELQTRADAPEVRGFRPDHVVDDFTDRVLSLERRAENGTPPTLRDIRELRRKIREAQGGGRGIGPEAVDYAALQRLEGALSADMYAAAGPAAARLRSADQYYARGMARIENVRRFFNAEDPADSVQQILRAANPRTENVRVLAALRSALPDSEWRSIAASLIDELGAPSDGAAGFVAQEGFSVANFATRWRKMTPRARRILFGSRGGQGGRAAATMRQLADDLDNLAEVALAHKGVERAANFSGSGRDVNNYITGLTAIGSWPSAVGMVGALAVTGEMLTNPGFVRWLVSAQRRGGGPAGMRRHLAGLRDLAARDPALEPAVAALEAQLQAQEYTPEPRGAGDRAGTLPQRERATQ